MPGRKGPLGTGAYGAARSPEPEMVSRLDQRCLRGPPRVRIQAALDRFHARGPTPGGGCIIFGHPRGTRAGQRQKRI